MCETCWKDYGSPKLYSPEIDEVAYLIGKIYEYSAVGGNAHIVVDDFNIKDENIQFCLDNLKENVHEAEPTQLAWEECALLGLKRLSLSERASALALHNGYFEKPKVKL